jgi:hypothetical protein
MFYIRPLKEETLYDDPWLVLYHDAISESQMERVKELATPRVR